MKILVIAKAYPPETGGIETYSEELAKAYSNLGHDVTVLTAHHGEPGAENRGAIAVYNVGNGTQLRVFARMLQWLRKDRKNIYDFVHVTTWRVAIPLLLTRPGARFAVTIHGREVFVVPALLKPIMSLIFNRAVAIPTVSQPILTRARQLSNLALPQAYPNWNGVSFEDEAQEKVLKSPDFNIFCMCRMVERKNVATAITAVSDLLKEGLNIQFDIAGGGEDLVKLKAHAAKQQSGDSIILHGRIPDDDISNFYQNAHVFLHPQIAIRDGGDLEGFGLTIADGMAFGCIPIAGSSGGPSDFIENGETGFLVDGLNLEEVKDRVRQLYQNRQLMEDMSERARRFALEELTWERHAMMNLDRFETMSAVR